MGARTAACAVRVEVLGPLRLTVGGQVIGVPGPKRRAALALLALAEDRAVTIDALVRGIWPDDDTQPGRAAVHTHISRLRSHLGEGATRLHTMPDGYRLQLDGAFDLAEARALFTRARASPDPQEALELLHRADRLWRGPVLADLDELRELALAAAEARRLHTEVIEALIETAVTVGRAGETLARATAHLADDPLREQAALALMRALAADGSAPEALRVSRRFRERIVEETGLDPSGVFGEVEAQIARGELTRSASRAPSMITPTTTIIGRDADVQQLHGLLGQERLIALVGPGGVGKTRVALEVARHHEDAVVVPLAPIAETPAIPHALAAALGLSVTHGDTLEVCLAFLADRACLLVIDNCEHLLDAVRDLVHLLLTRCPDLLVLATSREPLGLTIERVMRLAPLAVPADGEDPREAAAVQVFLDRAARVSRQTPSGPEELRQIADMVCRLDGMPLAIELAAGRLSTLALTDLHARLDRALDLLGGGRTSSEARHRTLRATLEWSYRLLDEQEQRLFRHLAVFADGFDLRTAEEIATRLQFDGDPAAVLARLVDASIIQLDATASTRYRMLATLQMFGLDRLTEAAEYAQAQLLLVRWARDLTAGTAAELMSEDEARADRHLRREFGNLRAAWRAAREQGLDQESAEIAIALFDVIAYRDLIEVRSWVVGLAESPSIAALPRAATVLGVAAEAAYQSGDHAGAHRLAVRGLGLAEDADGRWYCLIPLAVVALARGEHRTTVVHALDAAGLDRRPEESRALAALATAYGGDVPVARTMLQNAGRAGSPTLRAWQEYVAGEVAALAAEDAEAEAHYQRAINGARETGATFVVGIATVGLLSVRVGSGRVVESLAGYREVMDYFARTGNWTHLWVTLRNLARLLREHGNNATADLLDDAATGAPDAPSDGRSPDRPRPTSLPGRESVLQSARAAIDRLAAAQTERFT